MSFLKQPWFLRLKFQADDLSLPDIMETVTVCMDEIPKLPNADGPNWLAQWSRRVRITICTWTWKKRKWWLSMSSMMVSRLESKESHWKQWRVSTTLDRASPPRGAVSMRWRSELQWAEMRFKKPAFICWTETCLCLWKIGWNVVLPSDASDFVEGPRNQRSSVSEDGHPRADHPPAHPAPQVVVLLTWLPTSWSETEHHAWHCGGQTEARLVSNEMDRWNRNLMRWSLGAYISTGPGSRGVESFRIDRGGQRWLIRLHHDDHQMDHTLWSFGDQHTLLRQMINVGFCELTFGGYTLTAVEAGKVTLDGERQVIPAKVLECLN